MPTERERTAYHEAGHVVIDYRLGAATCFASIREGRDSLGRAAGNPRGNVDDRVVGLYAGYEAEARFAPGCSDASAREDYDMALELLDGRPGEALRERARALVVEHWSAIEIVARALLEWETLEDATLVIDHHDGAITLEELLRALAMHGTIPCGSYNVPDWLTAVR